MSYIGNSPGVASQRVTTTLTATAGQTQFTTQSGYVLGYVDVYLNGAKLVNGSDFEAITGTYITLFAGAAVGDVIELVSYVPRGLSDGYTKAEADAKFLDVGGDTATGSLALAAASLTGNLTLSGGTANGIGYLNASKVLTTGSGFTYDGSTISVGSSGVVSSYLMSSSASNQTNQIVSFYNNGSSYGNLAIDGSNLYFKTSGTVGATLTASSLYTASGINVGIGTSSPSGKLHVSQTSGSMYINVAGGIPRMYLGGGNGWGFNRITSTEDIFFGEPGDTGTWRVRGSGTISLGVGNTNTTMTLVGDGGSVGIGTTAPSAKLTVSIGSATSGTVARFSAPSYDDVYIAAGSSTTSCGIGTVSTSAFNLFVNSSSKVVVLNNGNVGIGVTNPRAPLDLGSQNNRGQVILLGEQSAAARVGFGLDSANAGMRIFTVNLSDQQIELGGISTSDGTTWTRNHRFGIAGGNTWLNEQGGSVSIGTTTSSGLLTLKNPTVSSENVLLAIQQNGVGTITLGKLTYNQSDDTMRLYNTSSYSGSGLIFGTSNVERVRITNNGQLFFGSTAPENLSRWGRALFNYASGTSNATIALQNGTARAANNLYGMLFVDNADESNAAVYVRQTGSNNGADLLFGTNAGTGGAGLGAVTERMRITAGGNVGLGTSAPGSDSKLDVVGNITIDSAFSSQYGICFRRGFETSDNLRIYAGDTGLGRTGGLRLSGYDGIAFGTGSNTWQERVRITNAGHMIPAANDTYDLGGVGSAWRNIYTNDLHLNNESKPGGNDIDGTTGNWTIQEGAENLYIINNKTGKKYTFVLKEVT